MELITHPHPLLRQVMPDVEVEQGIKTGKILLEEVQKRDTLVGLAANQIGIKERVCCFELLQGMLVVVVNPYIIEESENTYPEIEGCGSLPGVKVIVERPVWVKAKFDAWFHNLGSQKLLPNREMTFHRFPARVLQHEVDHLMGVLITDYAPGS